MRTPLEGPAARQRLQQLLAATSYEKRRIVLASGRESDFYFDSKKTVLGAEGAFLAGQVFFDALCALPDFDQIKAIGGLELGSVPLGTAIGVISHLKGKPLDHLVIRKQAKGHGTRAGVEGATRVAQGSRVVVVEDVVTTGGSSLRAVDRLRQEGYEVCSIITLIDREEGGRRAIEAADVALHSLFVRGDFEAPGEPLNR